MKQRGLYMGISLTSFAAMVLVACSGSSSTGVHAEHPSITKARAVLDSIDYSGAANMPIEINDKYPETYGWYENGVVYLTSIWIEDYKTNRYAPCTIVHEYAHHLQAETEYGTKWRDIAEIQADQAESRCVEALA